LWQFQYSNRHYAMHFNFCVWNRAPVGGCLPSANGGGGVGPGGVSRTPMRHNQSSKTDMWQGGGWGAHVWISITEMKRKKYIISPLKFTNFFHFLSEFFHLQKVFYLMPLFSATQNRVLETNYPRLFWTRLKKVRDIIVFILLLLSWSLFTRHIRWQHSYFKISFL
jgi:hypothetical protein